MQHEYKKTKILFLITQSEFGGAQKFLMEFAPQLDKAAYECVVASQKGDVLDVFDREGIATRTLRWLTRDISPFRDILALFEIRRLLMREQPDVLFLLSSKAGFLGSLATRFQVPGFRLHAPHVIYRIGGWAFNDPQPLLLQTLYIIAEKISARWKDVIIVNSRHDEDQARSLGIKPREKLVTIYNGIDAASVRFLSREDARNELSERTGFKFAFSGLATIGCIANFYKTKGLPHLIEAMKFVLDRYPDAKLILLGDGRERAALEGAIRGAGLVRSVCLAGRLPEAWAYLKAFDVFVLPSLKEGFPWVVLEAMAAEVPVIATRVGALPEIIAHEQNGLLTEAENSKDLADAILRLLDDRLFRERIASLARNTVMKRFDAKNMRKETAALL